MYIIWLDTTLKKEWNTFEICGLKHSLNIILGKD